MQEKKKQRKKWKRTHRPYAVQKRITHDICITRHKTLPSKTVKAISIDFPRQMRRVNRNGWSRGILVQVFQLNVTMQKKRAGMEKDRKKEHIPQQ